MLSKKMAVSLTSLITILALAFVVTPAMADNNIGSALIMDDDISHADGLQVQHPAATDGTAAIAPDATVVDLTVTLRFDKPVDLKIANISISIFDMDGDFIVAPGGVATADRDAANEFSIEQGTDLRDWMVVIDSVSVMARTVKIRVAEAVASSDKFEDNATKKVDHTVTLLGGNPTTGPDVYKIALVGEPYSPITTATFQVHVVLSEPPKEAIKDLIDASEATVNSVVELASPGAMSTFMADINRDGTLTPAGEEGTATWRDNKLHLYLVTLSTKEDEKTVTIKIKNFSGMERPMVNATTNVVGPQDMYTRHADDSLEEGRDILTVKTKRAVTTLKSAGIEVKLLNEGIIPKDGYLVVAKNKGGSAVRDPGDAKKSPVGTARAPFGLTYNLIDGGLQNLEAFLSNGGTIDLVAPKAGLVISEIMWGTDASLEGADVVNSQYIEIRNTSGAEIKMGDGNHKLVFYGAGAVLPDMSVAANNIQDRVGTVGAGGFWSIAGKGQSGRTGINEAPGETIAVAPTQALISMQRSISATGAPADGTLATSWAASTPPGLNFDLSKVGTRIGSPGRAPTAYPVAPTPAPEPTPAPVVPVAGAMDIMITEIMVDTGNGRLPQWIELTNVSGAEKSLAGWSLMITNAAADANVIGATVNINLSGTLGVGGGMDAGGTMGKSLLLVGGSARSSSNLAGSDRVVDISSQVDQRGRYAFISAMGFMAALIPPQKTGVLAYGDTAGNLGADAAWDIPMDDSGRSSLIRREMLADGMATMGTDANGWVLASDTPLVSGPATWYGSDEDAGTPGYDAGGPLPVELSHFRPARDKATGAVVITWATQSELNNAGFFIKRSNQRDGEFQVINATMVPGAGTTSEKQTYTYTDTTAQPNIVYYYQIEDVSLDGQRQTLTRGIRLKGHIGAAGKLTSTWGELKSSNE